MRRILSFPLQSYSSGIHYLNLLGEIAEFPKITIPWTCSILQKIIGHEQTSNLPKEMEVYLSTHQLVSGIKLRGT